MFALVDGTFQIYQVSASTFPVAPPLQWVACPENCTTAWTYNGTDFFAPQPSASDVYANKKNLILLSADAIRADIREPYSAGEADTWWCQYHEAEDWTADNSYVPVMLNAMVAASGGGWTLPALAASILTNAAAWKSAAGQISGQVKAKISELDALYGNVLSGSATVADLQAFDANLTAPVISLEDKF